MIPSKQKHWKVLFFLCSSFFMFSSFFSIQLKQLEKPRKKKYPCHAATSIQNYGEEVSTLKLSCWSAPNQLSGSGRCLRCTKVETLASGATDSSIQYFRRLFCTLNKGEEQGEKGKSMETLNMNLVLAQGCCEGSKHLWDHDAYNPDPSARRGRARRRQSVFTPQSTAATLLHAKLPTCTVMMGQNVSTLALIPDS